MKLTSCQVKNVISLYQRGFSTIEISQLFRTKGMGLCAETIRKSLKHEGIPLRSYTESSKLVKRKHLPIEKIIKEYQDGTSLRKLALTYRSSKHTLGLILKEKGITQRSNKDALRLSNMRHGRKFFSKEPHERAYMLGLITGDFTPYTKSKHTLRVITNTTINDLILVFTKTFESYGYIRIREVNHFSSKKEISVDLELPSFKFLLEKKNITSHIKHFKDDELLYFLAGLIDSDGSVILRKSGEYFQYVVRIYGEDKALLDELNLSFKRLGLNSHVYLNAKKGSERFYKGVRMVYNNDYYILEISKKDEVLKLLKNLPLKHPDKQRRRELIFKIESTGIKRYDELKLGLSLDTTNGS